MGTITKGTTKSGETRFYARIRRKGHAPLTGAFARLTDARQWVRQIESDMERGKYFAQDVRMTFAEASARYLADIAPDSLGAASTEKRTHHLKWWKERLGHMYVGDIKPQHIAEARDALRAQGMAPATVQSYLASISPVFRMLVHEHGLSANPAASVKRPALPPSRIRFLTPEERTALLDACAASPCKYLYDVVLLLMLSGMRKSELFNLRWSAVDLAANEIRLSAEDTKTRTPRVIPITAPMREILARRKADAVALKVFPHTSINTYWRKALAEAGIVAFVLHDLRHDAASSMATNGASLHEIAEQLGHRDLGTTRRYSHLTRGHMKNLMEGIHAKIMKK